MLAPLRADALKLGVAALGQARFGLELENGKRLAREAAIALALGEPGRAPVVDSDADAVRTRHVARRPSVSMTHWVSNEVALIAHGRAAIIGHGDADFDELSNAYLREWWQELRRQQNGAFLRVEPDALYTWARDSSAFPRD